MTQSLSDVIREGEGPQDAVPLDAGIFMSKGIANSYLVTTGDGDLLVNTGVHFEAPEIKARFERVSRHPLRAIVFTQGHPDHVGGCSQFTAPGVATIAQANHADVREYWRRLHPFYARRMAKLWGRYLADHDRSYLPPEPALTTAFGDSHAFELGGRRFELYSTPGGEAADALVVWLPADRIAFTGNLMGPLFGHVPNLYTIRGDKYRSAMAFIRSVDRVIDLQPETLITGHEVARGAKEIRQRLAHVRDATEYLRTAVIEGMNAGADLWTLMGQVRLPPELAMPQVHGKVPWIVRAIWEEHAGWFRYESTTELYDVPPAAIWGELAELAGGTDALVSAASRHVSKDQPLRALHFTDIVLTLRPADADALRVKLAALQQLLEASGRENFSEAAWLEAEMHDAREAMAG